MDDSHVTKAIAQARTLVQARLFPDTCQLYPRSGGNATVNEYGVLIDDTPVAKTYNGSTDIPCRHDFAQSFRPDTGRAQTLDVLEEKVQLPADLDIDSTDIMVIGGKRYEIRKLEEISSWVVTKQAHVMALTQTNDDTYA